MILQLSWEPRTRRQQTTLEVKTAEGVAVTTRWQRAFIRPVVKMAEAAVMVPAVSKWGKVEAAVAEMAIFQARVALNRAAKEEEEVAGLPAAKAVMAAAKM
jgi:hypothetical protein